MNREQRRMKNPILVVLANVANSSTFLNHPSTVLKRRSHSALSVVFSSDWPSVCVSESALALLPPDAIHLRCFLSHRNHHALRTLSYQPVLPTPSPLSLSLSLSSLSLLSLSVYPLYPVPVFKALLLLFFIKYSAACYYFLFVLLGIQRSIFFTESGINIHRTYCKQMKLPK